MAILIGVGLAVIVAVSLHHAAIDRDRALYPVILIVVASYYILFAAMAGGGAELVTEIMIFVLFSAAAVASFRTSLWIAVAGLAAHGAFDLVRHAFLAGRGVPEWWPGFCMGFDVAAAACLAVLLLASPPMRRTLSGGQSA